MKTDSNEEMICGLNAISQIIKTRPKSVKALFIINSPNERLKELIKLTEDQNIKVEKHDASFFDKNFEGINHQNVALRCNKRSEETEDYLELILDKEANDCAYPYREKVYEKACKGDVSFEDALKEVLSD